MDKKYRVVFLGLLDTEDFFKDSMADHTKEAMPHPAGCSFTLSLLRSR